MVQMAFCDLLHTFHKQVTNISQHVFVILLWGIVMSPLGKITWYIIQYFPSPNTTHRHILKHLIIYCVITAFRTGCSTLHIAPSQKHECIVSFVSRRYIRGENGAVCLVVCLSEYLCYEKSKTIRDVIHIDIFM